MNAQIVPFEQADSNPATKQYIDLVKASGGDISTLGALSASAFLLWATAANQCGANVTRDCVVSQPARRSPSGTPVACRPWPTRVRTSPPSAP